jgi:5-methylthioadenosine/S-adenosylhomocysteine deaminase
MSALRLRARWVLPILAPPIADGAVLVGEDGRITAVGEDGDVPRPAGVPSEDLGVAALLPGLVNTHTHLELTALRGLIRARPFAAWVRAVRVAKEGLAAPDVEAAARWGVLEQFAAGVTCIGDTGSTGAPAHALAALGARGVAYQEVFGPAPERLDRSLAELEAALAGIMPLRSPRLAIGVSPHAPYTVSDALLEAVCALAGKRGLPLAMHLAESADEHALIADAAGPFAEALRARGIVVEPRGDTPVAWALAHGLAGVRPLCIHVATADDEDLGTLAAAHATIAHCPWSNAVLGNPRASLGAMRRHQLTVGVGTDSVAAGGGIDLLAEARLATRDLELSPREQLRLVTWDAAAALGVRDVGALSGGAWGDLAAVGLPERTGDPEAWLAAHGTSVDVVGTWIAGRPVYRAGAWPGVNTAAERAAYEAACSRASDVRRASPD